MRLPRGEEAIVPQGKIEGYCLNPSHPQGGDKARVFAAALGLTAARADVLKAALRRAAVEGDAVHVASGPFGDQYRIDFGMSHAGRSRTIRSGWIVRAPGAPPYLTTAFVLPSSHG